MTFAISPYTKRKVLVVEDDRNSRLTLEDFLQHEGFYTFGVPDGYHVPEIVLNELIDLVLLDINLPGRDGIQILREIRYLRSALPVIMITGAKSPDLFHELIELDAFSLLPKPVDILLLRQVVREALFRF
jgi:two-component system response regulator (stage 0 sporulation protein F)